MQRRTRLEGDMYMAGGVELGVESLRQETKDYCNHIRNSVSTRVYAQQKRT